MRKNTEIIFKDKNLLKQAFIHRSYINENPGSFLSHNERLEFLGDAVLELIVTDFLYKKYPNYTEGINCNSLSFGKRYYYFRSCFKNWDE